MVLDPKDRIKTINEYEDDTHDTSQKTVFTVTRTYTAADGSRQVKTSEYYGPKAEKVSCTNL
jgi:hypothetical protein